jgi:hypothetical protein
LSEGETKSIPVSVDTYERIQTVKNKLFRESGVTITYEAALKLLSPDLRLPKELFLLVWTNFKT